MVNKASCETTMLTVYTDIDIACFFSFAFAI